MRSVESASHNEFDHVFPDFMTFLIQIPAKKTLSKEEMAQILSPTEIVISRA